MKNILLLIISIYWLIPKNKRRQCLFKESCSHYVYNATKKYGLRNGLQALQYRIRNCNKGSYVFTNPITNKIQMVLQNNEIIEEENIANYILQMYKD